MAADPFLKQVVTRTLEIGVRGELAGGTRWNATAFRSMNHDDLLFVGTGGSMGYFTNFGRTRRQGIELGLAGQQGPIDWRLDYTYLHATFRSAACLLAENNSTAGEGGCPDDEIRVSSGDYLPGLPKHHLKLGLDWNIDERLRLGTSVLAYSSQYVRGNENNRHRANDEFEGRGRLPGYAVVNLTADYRLARDWTLFGRVDNLFDQRYATGGRWLRTRSWGPAMPSKVTRTNGGTNSSSPLVLRVPVGWACVTAGMRSERSGRAVACGAPPWAGPRSAHGRLLRRACALRRASGAAVVIG